MADDKQFEALYALQEMQWAMSRLLNTMDGNLSLLEDSVREVRTARQIAAESNRMARRRAVREGNPSLTAASK